MLSLLIPAFSLLLRPHILSVMLHPYRMLLYHLPVSNNINFYCIVYPFEAFYFRFAQKKTYL